MVTIRDCGGPSEMTDDGEQFLAHTSLDAHEWRGVGQLANALSIFEPLATHPSGDVPTAVANVVFQPKSMVALSSRRGKRLQPQRLPFCLALGIYERHGDGATHQHNDPAYEEAGVEPVERCRGALNNTAHDIGCEQA